MFKISSLMCRQILKRNEACRKLENREFSGEFLNVPTPESGECVEAEVYSWVYIHAYGFCSSGF